MSKGGLVVIEGTDGSGKGTQTELLAEELKKLQLSVSLFDFPRYEENEYGKLIARYLRGEFGGLKEVSPYLASLAYAGDRMLAGPEIKRLIEGGSLVITNRYVLSNKAYMAARLKSEERVSFLDWLDNLEYIVNQVPREDLVIFLYVPFEISQQNLSNRSDQKDIMESDLEYMKEVEKLYLEFATQNNNWVLIECTTEGSMKSREVIHAEILTVLKEKNVIQG